jgi:hypothetical protein
VYVCFDSVLKMVCVCACVFVCAWQKLGLVVRLWRDPQHESKMLPGQHLLAVRELENERECLSMAELEEKFNGPQVYSASVSSSQPSHASSPSKVRKVEW